MTPGRYVSDNFKVYFLRNLFVWSQRFCLQDQHASLVQHDRIQKCARYIVFCEIDFDVRLGEVILSWPHAE